MRKVIVIICTLLAVNLASAQQDIFIPGYDREIDDEAIDLFPPYETVHSGRQLPRSFTVPYPDEETALAGSLEPSLYLQPMSGAPAVNDTGSHMEYTWTYKVPFTWVGRMVSVYIESADNPYAIIINGEEAGNNQSSRSAAEFDITALSKEGINTLTVKVEKTPAAAVISAVRGTGEIIGKVLVMSQPRIRVRDYVYEVNFAAEEPTLQLGIILKTHMLNPRAVRLHYAIKDNKGITVSSGHRDAQVGLKEEDTVRFFLTVKDLKPWSYETPNTYNLVIKNQYEGRFTEYVNYPTGFRNFRMQDGDLYSNGYKLPLAFHFMDAIPEEGLLPDVLSAVKREGYNIIIVPRHPRSEEFYRACDRAGLYVCNQADINTSARGSSIAKDENPSNDPRWSHSFTDRALSMYGTSANHPSVAMFSIARGSANGYNLYKSYLALKGREKERPVIYPEAEGQWNSDAVTKDFALSSPQSAGERIVLDPGSKQKAYPDSPYTSVAVDAAGNCTVANRALATKLRGELHYTVKRGNKKVSEGSVPVTVEPGEEAALQIPVPAGETGKKLKFEARLLSNFDGF